MNGRQVPQQLVIEVGELFERILKEVFYNARLYGVICRQELLILFNLMVVSLVFLCCRRQK